MVKLIRQTLQRLARLIDCELIPRWRLPTWPMSAHLAALFALYAIDVVLDVGANRGQYRDFLRDQAGYSGLIVSFEPVAANFAHLQERAAADPKWLIVGYALGRESGSLPLNVMRTDVFSSFRTPAPNLPPHLQHSNTVVSVQQTRVRILDDVWPELRASHLVKRPFLKIDTQGFDLEVIAGGSSVSKEIVALQSEVSVRALYQDVPPYIVALRHFETLGFQLTGMFPVLSDDALRVIEFDCVMVNERQVATFAAPAAVPHRTS